MSSKWTGARAATPRDGDERKERNEPSGNHRRGAAPFYSYENRPTRRWDDNRSRRGDVSRSDLVPSEASMLNFSYDDPKLSSLLHRIRREENSRKRNSALIEFKKYLSEPVSRRTIIRSADSLLTTLEAVFYVEGNHDAKENVVHCMGTIGFMMGQEGRRFVQWTLGKASSAENPEEVKVLFMSALAKGVELDSQRLYFTEFVPFLISNVRVLIENAESSELLYPLVRILGSVASNYPGLFSLHFKDVIDVLVGWHIDAKQPKSLIDLISETLIGMHSFWAADMSFSLNLIGQFFEDIDAYVQEMHGKIVSESGQALTPEECQSKMTSLLEVLSTVIRGLYSALQPSKEWGITKEYVGNMVERLVKHVADSLACFAVDEDLFIAGCDCLSAFVTSLQVHFSPFCHLLLPVLYAPADFASLQSFQVSASILDIVDTVLTTCERNVPEDFALALIADKSPLMALRRSKQDKILKAVVEAFHHLILTKSANIIEAVCQAMANDIQKSLSSLDATEFGDSKDRYDVELAERLLLVDLYIVRKVLLQTSPLKSVVDSCLGILVQKDYIANARFASHCPSVPYAMLVTLAAVWRSSSGGEDLTLRCVKIITALIVLKNLGSDAKAFALQWFHQMLNGETFRKGSRNDEQLHHEMVNALLSNAFDRERDVRLKTAQCLHSLVKATNLTEDLLQRILRECHLKLTDTDGTVRCAFVEIMESIPTPILINKKDFGSQENPLDSQRKSWQKRRSLVSQPSTGTFYGHHFQAIMNFVLKAATPSKRVNDDWLERLYHSCVRINGSSLPQMTQDGGQIDGCDALLWFWCLWESAQFIVLSKIKTPLGGPQDTFLTIGNVVKSYYLEAKDGTEPSQLSTLGRCAGIGPKFLSRHLRVNLLIAFVDFLERHIYNAHTGCAVVMPPLPKNIRAFFRTNLVTCQEWLRRLRLPLATVAYHAGSPAAAVRHCYERLATLSPDDPEFNQVLVLLASALCRLKEAEPLAGVRAWAKKRLGKSVGWLEGAVLAAEGRFELCAQEHVKFIEKMCGVEVKDVEFSGATPIDPAVMEFCSDQVLDCYVKLSDWDEAQDWIDHMQRGETRVKTRHDLDYVRSLCEFETGDVAECREILEATSGSSPIVHSRSSHTEERADLEHLSRPPWDPWQMLQASQRQLLLAIASVDSNKRIRTVPSLEEDSEEPFPLEDDEEQESRKEKRTRWTGGMTRVLNHAASYAEAYLRVSALLWPIVTSPYHAAQIHAVKAVLSDPNEESASLKFSDVRSLNPVVHDAGLASYLLRYVRHRRQNAATSLFNLTMSAAKLARKQFNYRFANRLLLDAGRQRRGEPSSGYDDDGDDASVRELLDSLTKNDSTPPSDLQIVYEGAKLLESRGNVNEAVHVLTRALAAARRQADDGDGVYKDESFSRALVRLASWIQSDSPLAASLVDPASPVAESVVALLPGASWAFRSDPFQVYPTSGLSDADGFAGVLLKLATESAAPRHAKAWIDYAGWCYRWGRKTIEQTSTMGHVGLLPEERSNALASLPDEATDGEIKAVLRVLGQAHLSDASLQVELVGNENLDGGATGSGEAAGADAIRRLLVQACPSLARSTSLNQLVGVWCVVSSRLFTHYGLAARAYFTYLNLSGTNAADLAEVNVTATLRLLRLLVKHAQELKDELEDGLKRTPTEPWKAIIPQLFSRLSHPEASVRQSVSQLLCRIAQDSPHLIIYPVVVGSPPSSTRNKKASGNERLLRSISRMDSLTTSYSRPGNDTDLDQQGYMPSEMLDNLPKRRTVDQSEAVDEEEEEPEREEEEEEKEETLTTLQLSYKTILDTLTQPFPDLVADTQTFVEELKRIRLLWEEVWMGALSSRQSDVSRRLAQLDGEVKRVLENATLGREEKTSIMRDKHGAVMKPVIVALEKMYEFTVAQTPETPHETWFQKTYGKVIEKALDGLKMPKDLKKPRSCWEGFRQLYQTLFQRSQKRAAMAFKLSDISPKLAASKGLAISLPGTSDDETGVLVSSFTDDVVILPTKTRPKKLSVKGSDGKTHTYLFKGLEDMHLDERVMQFLGIVNTMFVKTSGEEERTRFRARHYAVTPLGSRSGLVKWVDGATPLFALYKRWQQREAAATFQQASKPTTASASMSPTAVPPPPQRPSELFYGKLTPLLKEKGVSDLSNRKEWPLEPLLKTLEQLMAETPSDLLAKELWCASTGALEWWHLTQTYCQSTAVMSMVGYVIGLGDRHLDNLMIDLATGEIVHIDYNVCFEKGKGLRVPETVPFRLTQNIETAFGLTGIEGTFRLSCERIMKTLRRGRETLLTLLEAFVYDPLVDWTTGNEDIFTTAKTLEKKGDAAANKGQHGDEKKEMERNIMVTMFSSRVAEMRASWKKNKSDFVEEMDAVFASIDNIVEILKSKRGSLERLERLRDSGEVLLEAAKEGVGHPLFHVKERHGDYQKLRDEHEDVLQLIRTKRRESERWQTRHEETLRHLYAGELRALADATSTSVELDLAGSDAAADFLSKTGQSHLVVQCQKAQEELQALLTNIRAAVRDAIALLGTYQDVADHYPAVDFVAGNRCREWAVMFGDLLARPESAVGSQLLKAYVARNRPEADTTMQPDVVRYKVKAVHGEIKAALVEENARMNNLKERQQRDVNFDVMEKTIGNATDNLTKLIAGNQQSRLPSLCSIVVSALAALNMRWLVMEKTAAQAGDRLLELKSREGDWFLDELETISLNAAHFAELLKHFGQFSENDFVAITAIQPVYRSLQDLIHGCVFSLAPDVLNALLREENGWDEFSQSLDSAYTALKDYQQVKDDPTQAPLLLDLAKESFTDLLQSSAYGIYGQALTKLNQLFESIEQQLANLRDAVQKQEPIPPRWLDIDVVKETSLLQARISAGFGRFFAEEPSFAQKLPTIWSFFRKCHLYVTCLKTAVSAETPADLDPWLRHATATFARSPATAAGSSPKSPTYFARPPGICCFNMNAIVAPLKQFISDVVQQQVLGVPSEALASVVLHYLPRLGFNVDDTVLKARQANALPLSLESMAKKALEGSLHRGIVTRESLGVFSQHVSNLDSCWRKLDMARRLERNYFASQKCVLVMQRHLAQFQWLNDDFLTANDLPRQCSPVRNNIMADLRKACSSLQQFESNVKAQGEKLKGTEVTIVQRLRWAAGSNPHLNEAIDETEQRQKKRESIIDEPLKQLNDVIGIVETLLHFEAHRTRTSESTAGDKSVCTLLSRFCKSAKALEENAIRMSETERLYRALDPLDDGKLLQQQVTLALVESLVSTVAQEKRKIRNEMQQVDLDVKKRKELLSNHAVTLQEILKGQSNLLQDVWEKLQALSKYEGNLSGPIGSYTKQRQRFNDDLNLLIDALKFGLDERVSGQQLRSVVSPLKNLGIWLYDTLLVLSLDIEFPSPPSQNTSLAGLAEDKTDFQVNGIIEKKDEQGSSGSASKQREARDPKTGKALQERNTFAVNVWRRIKAKLEGKDVDLNKRLSVADQVDWVIQQAKSKENLALMYEGWTSWV